jgi:spermidine synthase
MLNAKWFLELTTDHEGSLHHIVDILHSSTTEFQTLEILRLASYGKCLVLDGKIQSSEADEFIYHESLVHAALVSVASPSTVLIAGGGEGATVREVLRHRSVKEVVLVDLDPAVVTACREYLPEWHAGAFDDRRLNVVFDDARKFIEYSDKKFDLIVLDLPEPFEGGPAPLLYTREFYDIIRGRLTKNGAMVTQATSTAVNNCTSFLIIANTIKEVFTVVRPYSANVPSFFSPWGFIFASQNSDPLTVLSDELRNRISYLKGLRFYDAETHTAMFVLPKFLREALDKETRINTDKNPLSFY